MKKHNLSFSGFTLKIIAIATMTVDHIGAIIMEGLGQTGSLYMFFRLIGRAAFPLFAFMVVEGIIHSHKPLKYLTRLAIMAVSIGLTVYLLELFTDTAYQDGNIFLMLLLGGAAVYALRQKGYLRLLALAPVAYTVLAWHFGFKPCFYPEYDMYGLAMIILFYLAYALIDWNAHRQCEAYKIDYDGYKLTDNYRWSLNVAASISLVSVNILWYIIEDIDTTTAFEPWPVFIQSFSILAGIFLLFYNGKRGYNAKWFQYGCYLYYPLHLVILNAILALIVMLY